MVFGDAWMVCKGCLGMYQYQIHLRKVILGHTLPLLQTHSCPLMRKSTFVWRYMDGVWGCLGMTWCCLEVSGWCVGVPGDVSIPNPFAKDYVCSDIAFLPKPSSTKNCLCLRVSGWCLGGVWECLEGPTVILDAVNWVLMPKQVIQVQLV